jgi:hypothetical protein
LASPWTTTLVSSDGSGRGFRLNAAGFFENVIATADELAF